MTYDDLVAERFAKPLWWKTQPVPLTPDGDLVCAQRRRDADAEAYPYVSAAS